MGVISHHAPPGSAHPQPEDQVQVPGRRPRYKWIVLSNTTLSMMMAMIDASIVIIAMPAIFRGIRLNPFAPGNVACSPRRIPRPS